MNTFLTVSALLLVASMGVTAEPDASKFKITTKKKDDAVTTRIDGDKVEFTVQCPSGISKVTIEATEAAWPKTVVVRLRLKGLENLQVSNGQVTLHAAVASEGAKPTIRRWKDGKENELLDAKSPFWMNIRLLDKDDKPAAGIPLKDGCFELSIPGEMLKDKPKTLEVQWIDFYRN